MGTALPTQQVAPVFPTCGENTTLLQSLEVTRRMLLGVPPTSSRHLLWGEAAGSLSSVSWVGCLCDFWQDEPGPAQSQICHPLHRVAFLGRAILLSPAVRNAG